MDIHGTSRHCRRSQPIKQLTAELSDGSEFEMWVTPLTMAEREKAQKGAFESVCASEAVTKAQDEQQAYKWRN